MCLLSMQAAREWLNIASRVASVESGMGRSGTAGLAFKLKRLVREYGTHSLDSIGRLNVAGMVPAIDVYRAFVDSNSYKLDFIEGLFRRRLDLGEVQNHLKFLIRAEVEVVPVLFLTPKLHRSMYVNRHWSCIYC